MLARNEIPADTIAFLILIIPNIIDLDKREAVGNCFVEFLYEKTHVRRVEKLCYLLIFIAVAFEQQPLVGKSVAAFVPCAYDLTVEFDIVVQVVKPDS